MRPRLCLSRQTPSRGSVRAVVFDAGARATAETLVAWLRLEPTPETSVPAELRLTVWDGTGSQPERLLATTAFHGGPIHSQPE